MRMQDCPSFNTCSAPLCPLDEDIAKRIWIPGDPICTIRPIVSPVVKNQRQLAGNQNEAEFYTGEMLAELRDGLNDPNQHGIAFDTPLADRKEAIRLWLLKNRSSLKSNKNKGKIFAADYPDD